MSDAANPASPAMSPNWPCPTLAASVWLLVAAIASHLVWGFAVFEAWYVLPRTIATARGLGLELPALARFVAGPVGLLNGVSSGTTVEDWIGPLIVMELVFWGLWALAARRPRLAVTAAAGLCVVGALAVAGLSVAQSQMSHAVTAAMSGPRTVK